MAPEGATGLDRTSDPHPLLLAKFNEFMRAFLLAGDGGTQSWDPDKVSTGEKSAPTPQSATAQEMAYWDREWRRQSSDRARLELLVRMQPVVTRLRFAPHTLTERGTLEWKRAVAKDPREPADVWGTYDISRATWYRIKAEVKKRGG
jgi:hypothetical protein